MPSISRSDITEETYLVWACPNCKEMNEVFDDGELQDLAVCENCSAEFEIKDN